MANGFGLVELHWNPLLPYGGSFHSQNNSVQSHVTPTKTPVNKAVFVTNLSQDS